MIQNDTDLQLTRDQMQRLENTLSRLRAEVEPRSPRRFRLMAEAYVESLNKLRATVDVYLGVGEPSEVNAPLVLTLEGDGVRLGEARGSVVTRTYENLRKGIASVLDALTGTEDGPSGGRRKHWIEEVTDVPFTLASGSVRIVLGEPTTNEIFSAAQLADYDKALSLIVKAAEWADDGLESSLSLEGISDHVRHAVLLTLRRLVPSQGSEVETVTLGGRLVKKLGGARLSKSNRGRIDTALRGPAATTEYAELQGTIREVDLDKREFRLRGKGSNPSETECVFDERIQGEVTSFFDLGEPVVVAGMLQKTKGRDGRLEVELVTPLDATPDSEAATPKSAQP
ncbi:MAG: hypothetical protein AABZ53_08275 [Planctomycetota bacterium]